MSQFPSDTGASSPSTSVGDFHVPAEQPGWPKAVGIISIVLGSLGTLCGLCGAVFLMAMGPFMEKMADFQAQAIAKGGGSPPPGALLPTTHMPPELMPGALSMASVFIGLIGSITLLVAGISTVRRSAGGRTQHLAYAGIAILAIVLGMIGAYMYQTGAMAFMAAHPDDPWSIFYTKQGSVQGQIVQSALISCVTVIYPIFCIIWFGVKGKRPEVGKMIDEPLV